MEGGRIASCDLIPKTKPEFVVPAEIVDKVITLEAVRTGERGGNNIFVSPLERAINITTTKKEGHCISRYEVL